MQRRKSPSTMFGLIGDMVLLFPPWLPKRNPTDGRIRWLTPAFQTTLQFSCICSNNQSPNTTEYSQTIPYFECTQFNTNCVNACPAADNACQSACRQNHPCGATDPRRYNLTSTSSTMSSSSTDMATMTGSGSIVATATDAGASASASAAAAAATQTAKSLNGNSGSGAGAVALDLGRVFGTALLLGALVAGFLLFL